MITFFRRHRENLLIMMVGLIVFAALNIMMLFYHYDAWTNPKVGFWTAFWNRFEVSGFDPYTYIVISDWRPLYVLSRHPLLAAMMWPFSCLNEWLKDITGINCAIHIVAVLWTFLSTCSWILMYRIVRKIIGLDICCSLLTTVFFFSFSHVLLITFVEDHMSLTLPLLLLAIYLGGRCIRDNRRMPLWQALPLLVVSTGVTTTNCVKIGFADLFTRWRKEPFFKTVVHFLIYLIPLALILGAYFYQQDTTQAEERKSIEHTVSYRAQRDSVFAEKWKREQMSNKKIKEKQLLHLSFVTNTDYKIDRLPSLIENIFGEGFILHDRYPLTDANKQHRPVLVRYTNPWMYAIEGAIVLLFVIGLWCGRRERLMWMVFSMFAFDMLLHVGLNFASADVYIMTAHWAFVIPIAVAYLMKRTEASKWMLTLVQSLVLFLTIFMLVHNLEIIAHHILP